MRHQETPLFYAVAACVVAVALGIYAVWAQYPPRPLPMDAPADQFSAHRAIPHAFACSMAPHPAGTKANDEVADYFLNALDELGVETEVMRTVDVRDFRVELQQAVIGRIPGTDSTGAIAISAHYDSVPYGPGATDDIMGCIAMVEMARAFMNRPRMRNDLLFLFLDAEEIGGYGARGFCNHPLAEDIGVVINLEARGTKGPALLFETSTGNSPLITELRNARAKGVLPVANSMMFAAYEQTPFGTDFTHFRRAGMHGYNIAYIDNFAYYHTMNDSPENLHAPSVQHVGTYIMGLAEHFGNVDFTQMSLEAENDIYFNTLGFHMVQYPKAWGLPLGVLAGVLVLMAVVYGKIKKRISLAGLLLALMLMPVTLGIAIIAAVALQALAFGYENTVHLYTVSFTYLPDLRALYYGNLYGYAYGLIALAVMGMMIAPASRRLRVAELYAAGLLWLCPMLVLILRTFPGGSHLFSWPLIFGALGLVVCCMGKSGESDAQPGRILIAAVFAVPALCLLLPMWQGLMWLLVVLGAPLLAGLAVLILFNLMPVMVLVGRARRMWLLYPAVAVLAVLLVGTGLVLSRPGKATPQVNAVAYWLDMDTGDAYWVSEDKEVDSWTRQFFPDGTRMAIDDILPHARGDHYLRAEAPVDPHLAGLQYDIISDETIDDVRRVTLHLNTNDAPFHVSLRQVDGPDITAAEINGTPVRVGEGRLRLSFHLFAHEGYRLYFETTPEEAIVFRANSTIYGFPEVPDITPRPDHMVPEPNTVRHGISLRSEHMFVGNSVTIPVAASGETGFAHEEAPSRVHNGVDRRPS